MFQNHMLSHVITRDHAWSHVFTCDFGTCSRGIFVSGKFTSFYHKSSSFIGHCSSYYPLIETAHLSATVGQQSDACFRKNIYYSTICFNENCEIEVILVLVLVLVLVRVTMVSVSVSVSVRNLSNYTKTIRQLDHVFYERTSLSQSRWLSAHRKHRLVV